MNITVDYHKSVDILDEGIMALSLFRTSNVFPNSLRQEISQILEFLKLADKSEYQELLYDKRITISKENLDSIHVEIKKLKFPVAEIENAEALINKTVVGQTMTSEEITQLEKYLLELSHPIWVTSLSKK